MRFEHILQIYWTKGFFYGGKLFYFNLSFEDLFFKLPGLGGSFRSKLISRFELTSVLNRGNFDLNKSFFKNSNSMLRPLNIIFSQINSVNNQVQDTIRLSTIRDYLIKSYRGRCHALGKPVRGQRTWSNAWNSFNLNKNLKLFISETSKALEKDKVKEKINYKVIKKKYITKRKKIQTNTAVSKKMWF